MYTIRTHPFRSKLLTNGFWLGIVEVGPAAASELLALNTKNRRVKPTRVSQYTAAMREGRWQLAPDFLTVDNSVLVNGQHRLRAVVAADVTVLFGLMVDGGTAFDVTDNGAPRTGADVLFLAGISEYPATLAQAVRLFARACGEPATLFTDNRYLEAFALERPELIAKVNMLEALGRSDRSDLGTSLSVPLAVLTFASIGRQQEHAADLFAHKMMTGDDVAEGEPADVLRRLIIKRLTRVDLHRYNALELLELLTAALDAQLSERSPTSFRVRGTRWRWGEACSAIAE